MDCATKNANVIEIALGSPQRLGYLHKTFALDLIKSVLTNYHELFRKMRTPSGSFHTSSARNSCPLFQCPLSLLLLKTLRFPSCALQDLRRLYLT